VHSLDPGEHLEVYGIMNTKTCPACRGLGTNERRLDASRCKSCDGTGIVTEMPGMFQAGGPILVFMVACMSIGAIVMGVLLALAALWKYVTS
jgi:DnaJ-class molecular chaperone